MKKKKIIFTAFFEKNKWFIEPENKEKFARETAKENYTRMVVISFPLLILECFLLIFEESLFGVGKVIREFVILCAVFLPFIWYGRVKIKTVSLFYAYFIQYAFILFCIIFGASLSLFVQGKADLIHMYLMFVFFAAAFFYMRPYGSAILFAIGYFYFILRLPEFVSNPDTLFVIKINTAASNAAAWIMGNVLWRAKIQIFKNKTLLFKQNTKLMEINKKDLMTKLYNHEASLTILKNEISSAVDLSHPLSLIITDIDDFKKVNDSHGHLTGDNVIKDVANIITENVRSTDFVGRYGGEEFIIIMPHTTLEYARSTAERIRRKINESDLCGNVNITISGGISQFDGEDINGFIRITDQKLYIAKNTGKNRFESQIAGLKDQYAKSTLPG